MLSNDELDINAQRHGRYALHYAAMRGSIETIQFLITNGANVHVTSTKDFNESIVHCAAVNSHPVQVFQLLATHNVNFVARDSEGTNALHLLVGFDSVFNKYSKATEWDDIKDAIEFLTEKGIDPRKR